MRRRRGWRTRTHLRFPSADVRKAGVVEERHIDRHLLLELATGAYVQHRTNVVFHGMAGSGKSCLMCAPAKESCHRQHRCLYMRIPDLATEREGAENKDKGETKLLAKLTNYDVLCLDEWLLDPPEPEFRSFLFELIERRYDAAPTLPCTQYPKKDWHQRLGGGVHADAIMDRIVHNAVWYYAGDVNMRECYGKGGADEQPSAGLNAKVAGGSLGCERSVTLAANGGHPTCEPGVAKPANIQRASTGSEPAI